MILPLRNPERRIGMGTADIRAGNSSALVARRGTGDLDKSSRSSGGAAVKGLRSAPRIHHGDLVDAGNGAVGRATLLGEEFALALSGGVFGERDARVAALLGAIVHQAVLADIEVARSCAATPLILATRGDIVLESVHARE